MEGRAFTLKKVEHTAQWLLVLLFALLVFARVWVWYQDGYFSYLGVRSSVESQT